MILSIDIGKVNTGCALVDEKGQVHHTQTVCASKDEREYLEFLYDLVRVHKVSTVLIERQVPRNSTAFRLMGMLHGYMLGKGDVNIHVISPTAVKRAVQCPSGLSHYHRKRFAVKQVLKHVDVEGDKKDDMCDSILNAWVFLGLKNLYL